MPRTNPDEELRRAIYFRDPFTLEERLTLAQVVRALGRYATRMGL
jgi:hypothetical protein